MKLPQLCHFKYGLWGHRWFFFPPSSQTKCLNRASLEKDSEGSRTLLLLFSCSVMSDSFLTPWTIACQVLLSMEFSRQEYWSGLPFPSPGDLPDPGIKPASPALQADSLLSKTPEMEKAMAPHSSVLKRHQVLSGDETNSCSSSGQTDLQEPQFQRATKLNQQSKSSQIKPKNITLEAWH